MINPNGSPTQFKIHFIMFQLCKSACCDVTKDTDTSPVRDDNQGTVLPTQSESLSLLKHVEGTAKNPFHFWRAVDGLNVSFGGALSFLGLSIL